MVYYDYRSINSGNLMNKNAIVQYQDVNERGIGALNLSGVTYVRKTKRVCIEKKIFLGPSCDRLLVQFSFFEFGARDLI